MIISKDRDNKFLEGKFNNVFEPISETFLDRWAKQIREELENPIKRMRELNLIISDYKDKIEFLKWCPIQFSGLRQKCLADLQKYKDELKKLENDYKLMQDLLILIEQAND
ncbi:MAG: hypothetical protein A4E52_00497 [Pelotomaculum sp. PtaB.Bin013]|uniref:Uncharacterized protein n=1 Tax=Pelotomaculum isophthalicicum JI TaxID=947010 RepID=A0A9X4H0H1_9FIRM|nr:hypothetical protein [Pelotomaculum isophthalicicum]MDF9409832.1 hypothetical protein [Pelotomaculum isophthalicicum JI]OPX91391.1 MAG: hypothetical protein A4E52_00497 [Pelotomaculum sp. PtaB.Bin013]